MAVLVNDLLLTSVAVIVWVAVQVTLAPAARVAGRPPLQLMPLISGSVTVGLVRSTSPMFLRTMV